jgi:hypothetical protein
VLGLDTLESRVAGFEEGLRIAVAAMIEDEAGVGARLGELRAVSQLARAQAQVER